MHLFRFYSEKSAGKVGFSNFMGELEYNRLEVEKMGDRLYVKIIYFNVSLYKES